MYLRRFFLASAVQSSQLGKMGMLYPATGMVWLKIFRPTLPTQKVGRGVIPAKRKEAYVSVEMEFSKGVDSFTRTRR